MYQNGDFDLIYGIRDNNNFSFTTLDDEGNHYWTSSLKLDKYEKPHIVSYLRDYPSGLPARDLYYARMVSLDNWQFFNLDSTNNEVAKWNDIDFDSFNNPHIAYVDVSFGRLLYTFHADTGWLYQQVGDN